MKGMFFVEIINNHLTSQGRIKDAAGPGHWSIHFFEKDGPGVTRVVPAGRMESLHLFNSMQDMEGWLNRNMAPAEPKEGLKSTPLTPESLGEMKVKELRKIAKGLGAAVPARAHKSDIIANILAKAEEAQKKSDD